MSANAVIDETILNDKEAALSTEAPASALVGESLKAGSFASFFASTFTLDDIGTVEQDLGRFGFTPLVSEEVARPSTRWRSFDEQPQTDQFERVNNDRIALLARKYVNKESFSDEEHARLAIVTERVRRLLPAVTSNDFERIEKFVQTVQRIGAADAEIRKRVQNH